MKRIRSAVAVAVLSAVVVGPAGQAFAGSDYWDRSATLRDLERSEARGGPYIKGGRSGFQTRFRVCNILPTPTRDPQTGERIYVNKEVCWFE
ncbi:hypothetical protein HPQ64_08285 [Rhizobiales bacterium]|uniref:hypothetical protein n=1 Tax=Hongsoonwoonella zoysiae TaxID=2821844 RepID=UPI0015606790|nr:hypothetical protein [Hongsoonwoonella zoysiae]NRG17684.1 hypothetical protein [Hongsoonwoonella zoysiae]